VYLRFWGVRGSIPTPGPETVQFGGNTACLELRYGEREQHLVIIDAGTGIKWLGDRLVEGDLANGPISARIFLTHTHWDHIMGFPFFTPIFFPETRLWVYSPVSYDDESIEQIVGNQLSYRHFPIRQSELSATITYHELREEHLELPDGMLVTTKFLNHPVMTLGYRFEYEGKVLCTLYDHEPYRNVFPDDPADPDYDEDAAREGEAAAQEENERILGFMQDADIVVYDTQYTREEYLGSKLGWGHSSFEHAINSAHKAGVKHLVFFHHDPVRSDGELRALLGQYRQQTAGKTSMQIDVAAERETFVICDGPVTSR
jgi:phosphoribosyl 1,2-cyclic phosphodiesterase